MQRNNKKFQFLPYFKRHGSLDSIPENISVEDFNIEDFNITMALPLESSASGAQSVPPLAINNQSFNELYNTLRIPDVIKNLPKFDGNPKALHEFINNVEEILQLKRGTDGTPYGQILLRTIRNKIGGQANEVLNMYGTPFNWDDIKYNLILHYTDKRTETSLIRDLHDWGQKKSVQDFYDEIISIQSALNNNLLLNESDSNVISSKKSMFNEMCLNSFLVGLKEPLGSNTRAMRPDSLATALSCCIKEQNIYYQQSGNDGYTYPQGFSRQYSQFNPYPPPRQMNHRFRQPMPYRQAIPYHQTNSPRYFNNQYQNFNKYQQFRTNNPNNYNNNYSNTQNPKKDLHKLTSFTQFRKQ